VDFATLPQLVRNAGRLNEIVAVLSRYGLAPWLGTINADWIHRHFQTRQGDDIAELRTEERVRLALTELGTTFIKLGQILSTRVDLVGPELAAELTKLQSSTPPDAAEQVIETITAELGRPPSEVFGEFDEEPVASGSIGQVHFATLVDGTPAVVKVQHAGIEERIRNDIEIMMELAKAAEAYAPPLRQYRPTATAGEFKRTIERELDFSQEQRNLQRFARNFKDDEGVRFPAPYPECSSKRVLTMDRMSGVSLSQRAELETEGCDLTDLARRGADMFLRMVFRDGFYHADPHPGNLMVLQDDVIGVLDCGMVGRIDDDLRERIEDLLLAALNEDADRLLDGVVRIGDVPPGFDRDRLSHELNTFVDEYGSMAVDEFDLSGALNGMISIIRSHQISLPPHVSLLVKMLVMLEGTSRQLAPDFSLTELLEPYRFEFLKRRLSPARLWKKLQAAHRDWSELVEAFPGDVADIMRRLRQGRFDVNLEHRRLDSVVNRLVMGIITAALFVGSASLWSNNVKPVLWGTSVPGALGCAVAVYLGFQLIRAIRKSGNLRDRSDC